MFMSWSMVRVKRSRVGTVLPRAFHGGDLQEIPAKHLNFRNVLQF